MSFQEELEEWILLDNQLKIINEKIKLIRERKNNITKRVLKYVEENSLTNTNINTKEAKIKFVTTNLTPPITFKYLETCLQEIIKNESQVKKIIDYIKIRREIKQSLEIKRFNNN
jgi:hypothetical protein